MTGTIKIGTIEATSGGKVNMGTGHYINQGVIQTQYARHTAKSVITSTSFQAIFTCNITPKFATSKVLIQASFSGTHRNYHSGLIRIYRNIGGTVTVQGGGLDSQDVGTQWSNVWFNVRKNHESGTEEHMYSVHTYAGSHLDSPNTNAEIVYTMSGMTTGDTSHGLFVNRTGQNTQAYDSSCACTLTLTEIAQ